MKIANKKKLIHKLKIGKMEAIEQKNQGFASRELEDVMQLPSSPQQINIPGNDEIQTDSRKESISSISNAKKPPSSKKKSKSKVILNISDTRYEVVKYVGKNLLDYKLTSDPEVEWDLLWTDNAVQPETLAKMQPFQKINHFPGMYSLARKNHLGRNLMRMKKAFPENYQFFPQTYLLPAEYSEFKMQFNNKKSKTFIVKPEASCQGRGIFLTRTWENIQSGEHYVVQRYLHKPFLLEGLKFDLRIYVLLVGCDPLRIYLYNDGLGRFATEEYTIPTAANLENMCMHLTNYAINKDNPNFVFNEAANEDNVGHKRSLKAVLKMLEELGHDVKGLWNEIKKIIIKTFCSVQPILAHSYKSCQPEDPYNNMCFELLGFDIILDHKLKPWLLEVNHTPSFTTDTPLDKVIKQNVIKDALTLMNVSVENRVKHKNKKKVELQQRVLTGKKIKMNQEERQAIFEKAQKERDEWEAANIGGYEKIFPFDDPSQAEEEYSTFISNAQKWWEVWTGTAIKKNTKKSSNETKAAPTIPSQASSSITQNNNNRSKDSQTIHSQKIKSNVPNKKAVSFQKVRTNSISFPINSYEKNISNCSTIREQIESQTSLIKAQQSAEKVQSWVVNEIPKLAEQIKVVGEDEADNFRFISAIEEENQNEYELRKDSVGPEIPIKEEKLLTRLNHSRVASVDSMNRNPTLAAFFTNPENNSLLINQELTKLNAFRIKKLNGVDWNREPLQNKSTDKENSKLNPLIKSDIYSNQFNKALVIHRASSTISLTKMPEKITEMHGLKDHNPEKTSKIPSTLKLIGTSVFAGLEDEDQSSSHPLLDNEKKIKSFSYIAYPKNTLKAHYNKVGLPLLQQQKNFNLIPNRNYLAPKVFELHIQGSKREQPKNLNINSSSGTKSFGRNRGITLSKEANNNAGTLSLCFQDVQPELAKNAL